MSITPKLADYYAVGTQRALSQLGLAKYAAPKPLSLFSARKKLWGDAKNRLRQQGPEPFFGFGHDKIRDEAMRPLWVPQRAKVGFDAKPLEELAAPTLLNKVDRFFAPKLQQPSKSDAADKAINAEKSYLKKRYNVTARLTGSMPQKLNLPGDVDLDFFVRVDSKPKFEKLVNKLENNPRYTASEFNKQDAGFHVFNRSAEGDADYPVDLAIAYGDPARQYVKALKEKKHTAVGISDPLRQSLIEKKNLLKHSPLDFKGKRYKRWKRHLDKALGSDMRLTREKISGIISADDDKFNRFLDYKDIVGHRTPHAEAVLKGGKILSSAEAHSKGKLKSYEFKGTVGDRESTGTGPIDKKNLTSNIYVTGGGLLDEPAYGDVGVVFRSRKAKKSPFLNLITNEKIIEAFDEDKYRQGNLKGDAYVVAKKDRVKDLAKQFPDYRYVPEEDLSDEQRKKLMLPTKSIGEMHRRWLPSAVSGDLKVRKYAEVLQGLTAPNPRLTLDT